MNSNTNVNRNAKRFLLNTLYVIIAAIAIPAAIILSEPGKPTRFPVITFMACLAFIAMYWCWRDSHEIA